MNINISYDPSVDQLDDALKADFESAVNAAVAFYDKAIANPIDVTIDFGWGEVDDLPLGSGDVGSSEANWQSVSYSQLAAAATAADTTSSLQEAAAKLLPAADPTNGSADFLVASAQAQALGLSLPTSGPDGWVGLNSAFAYSWTASSTADNTINAVSVLEHEISEALGRVDYNGRDVTGDGDDAYTLLDFYRYTEAGALSQPFVQGYNPHTQTYFSYNGVSMTLPYDTYSEIKSGADVADWTSTVSDDSYGYASNGKNDPVSETDLQEMDVLGYDIANTINQSVPSSLTDAENGSASLKGISVSTSSLIGTAATTVLTTTLTATDGVFDATGAGAAIVGAGTQTLVITGTAAQINSALAGASYQADANFLGQDTIVVSTDDQIMDTSGPRDIAVTVSDNVPCFVAGTRLLTDRGEIPVERLRVGDRVVTHSGAVRPIRWIGHREVECGRHANPDAVRPIFIAAGAIASGAPRRDLWLSPGHCLFIDGCLTPAEALANGATVARVDVERVGYWHVELDSHDVLMAEGLPAESFLDCGNKPEFATTGRVASLHAALDVERAVAEAWAHRACAPRRDAGAWLVALRARLWARALWLGARVAHDPDLEVVADGARLAPARVDGRRFEFETPARTRSLRLRSRSAIPSELPHMISQDRRRLGVALTSCELDGRSVRLDHPAFRDGWRAPEPGGGGLHVWTNGDAALPIGGRLAFEIQTLPAYPLPWPAAVNETHPCSRAR